MTLGVESISTWANHWVNGLMGFVQTIPTWANYWVNGLMGWANHWINGLGWGLLRICFETDTSFETRYQNRKQKSEVTKLQGWGNDYLPIFNGCRQCRRPQNRKEDGGRETRSVARPSGAE